MNNALRETKSIQTIAALIRAWTPGGTHVSIIEANTNVVRLCLRLKTESFTLTWFPSEPNYLDLRRDLYVDVLGDNQELKLRRELDVLQQDATFVKASLQHMHGKSYNIVLCVEQSVGNELVARRAALTAALRHLRVASNACLAAQQTLA